MVSVPGTPRSVPGDAVVGLACSASLDGRISLIGHLRPGLSRLHAARALLPTHVQVLRLRLLQQLY